MNPHADRDDDSFPKSATRSAAADGVRIILEKGPATLVVSSCSMQPALRPGDRVYVVPAADAKLRTGDVVVAERGGGVVIHRFLARRGAETVLLKGDSVRRADPPLARTNVLGVAVARERNGRLAGLRGTSATLRGLYSRVEHIFSGAKDFFGFNNVIA